jgi:Protein of unknown function (DUF1312).
MKPIKKLGITKWDKIIIVFLLLLSIFPAGTLMLKEPNKENSQIVIEVDNKVEKSILLNYEEKSEIYEFSFGKKYRIYRNSKWKSKNA